MLTRDSLTIGAAKLSLGLCGLRGSGFDRRFHSRGTGNDPNFGRPHLDVSQNRPSPSGGWFLFGLAFPASDALEKQNDLQTHLMPSP